MAVPRFAAAVPAAAAPLAVAWPHGAPAIGAGVLIALAPTALVEGVPRVRLSFVAALVFAASIAIVGDTGLARGGAAGIAVAAAALVSLRSADDIRLAAAVFGATASLVAIVAALHGTTGVRADILAVAAALGLAVSVGTGLWGVAAADLAGVLALPSRGGLIAVAALLVALAHADRRNVAASLVAALAIAAAWLAGAPAAHEPFVHGAWRHASGFADSYHRLGVVGAALFGVLLVALLGDLPRVLSPAAFGVAAGAAFVPLEATAPLWLIVGFAAGGPAYDRAMSTGRERRLVQIERSLESQLRELDAERRRLGARREALDAREGEVAANEAVVTERQEALARREAATAAFEREVAEREAALETGTWAISQAHLHPSPPPAQPQSPPPQAAPPEQPRPRFQPAREAPVERPRFRPTPPPAPPPPAAGEPPEQLSEAHVPEPLPSPPPALPLQAAPRIWNLRALEALVASHVEEFPDRADEWRGYLTLLKDHAVNGLLPERFDPLVLEIFAPILPR